MSSHNGKEMNFELDLLPVIAMMSVCICFLLLTAVWTQVGSLDIAQGLGQESLRAAPKDPSLWVSMKDGGEVTLTMMDSPSTPAQARARSFSINQENEILGFANELKGYEPGLKTALIMAEKKVNYGDVIHIMDRLKGLKIGEIGIAPL